MKIDYSARRSRPTRPEEECETLSYTIEHWSESVYWIKYTNYLHKTLVQGKTPEQIRAAQDRHEQARAEAQRVACRLSNELNAGTIRLEDLPKIGRRCGITVASLQKRFTNLSKNT